MIERQKATRAQRDIDRSFVEARGYTTSEFWIVVMMIVCSVIGEARHLFGGSQAFTYATIASVIFYKAGRFWLKSNRSKHIDDVETLAEEITETVDELELTLEELRLQKSEAEKNLRDIQKKYSNTL